MRWLSTLSRRLEVWRPAITRSYIGVRTAVMRRRESLSRHLEVLRSAWEDQRHQSPTVGLTGREAQFLPAVLEIQDAPPSPVGRAVGGTIIGGRRYPVGEPRPYRHCGGGAGQDHPQRAFEGDPAAG